MGPTEITLTSEITVEAVGTYGGDRLIGDAAVVSTSADRQEEVTPDRLASLIHYLMSHQHGPAFEHSALTFRVHAPAFVWAEWQRHRVGMSFNMENARFKPLAPVFWVPRPSRPMVRTADSKPSRPRSVPAPPAEILDTILTLRSAYSLAWTSYRRLVDAGIAADVARACLPMALYFAGYVTCNPRSLMRFLSARTRDPRAVARRHPPAEIEEAALSCEEILKTGWPLTWEAFNRNGRVAP
jgi:thymidylate synthase (FAD)